MSEKKSNSTYFAEENSTKPYTQTRTDNFYTKAETKYSNPSDASKSLVQVKSHKTVIHETKESPIFNENMDGSSIKPKQFYINSKFKNKKRQHNIFFNKPNLTTKNMISTNLPFGSEKTDRVKTENSTYLKHIENLVTNNYSNFDKSNNPLLKSVVSKIICQETENNRIMTKSLQTSSMPKLRMFQSKNASYQKKLMDPSNKTHQFDIKKVFKNTLSKIEDQGVVRNKYMLCNHHDFEKKRKLNYAENDVKKKGSDNHVTMTYDDRKNKPDTQPTMSNNAVGTSMISPRGKSQAKINNETEKTINKDNRYTGNMEEVIPFINLYSFSDTPVFEDKIDQMKLIKTTNTNKKYDTAQKKDFVKRLVQQKSLLSCQPSCKTSRVQNDHNSVSQRDFNNDYTKRSFRNSSAFGMTSIVNDNLNLNNQQMTKVITPANKIGKLIQVTHKGKQIDCFVEEKSLMKQTGINFTDALFGIINKVSEKANDDLLKNKEFIDNVQNDLAMHNKSETDGADNHNIFKKIIADNTKKMVSKKGLVISSQKKNLNQKTEPNMPRNYDDAFSITSQNFESNRSIAISKNDSPLSDTKDKKINIVNQEDRKKSMLELNNSIRQIKFVGNESNKNSSRQIKFVRSDSNKEELDNNDLSVSVGSQKSILKIQGKMTKRSSVFLKPAIKPLELSKSIFKPKTTEPDPPKKTFNPLSKLFATYKPAGFDKSNVISKRIEKDKYEKTIHRKPTIKQTDGKLAENNRLKLSSHSYERKSNFAPLGNKFNKSFDNTSIKRPLTERPKIIITNDNPSLKGSKEKQPNILKSAIMSKKLSNKQNQMSLMVSNNNKSILKGNQHNHSNFEPLKKRTMPLVEKYEDRYKYHRHPKTAQTDLNIEADKSLKVQKSKATTNFGLHDENKDANTIFNLLKDYIKSTFDSTKYLAKAKKGRELNEIQGLCESLKLNYAMLYNMLECNIDTLVRALENVIERTMYPESNLKAIFFDGNKPKRPEQLNTFYFMMLLVANRDYIGYKMEYLKEKSDKDPEFQKWIETKKEITEEFDSRVFFFNKMKYDIEIDTQVLTEQKKVQYVISEVNLERKDKMYNTLNKDLITSYDFTLNYTTGKTTQVSTEKFNNLNSLFKKKQKVLQMIKSCDSDKLSIIGQLHEIENERKTQLRTSRTTKNLNSDCREVLNDFNHKVKDLKKTAAKNMVVMERQINLK